MPIIQALMLIAGIGGIVLGIKGLGAEGIPFTKDKKITGTPAVVVGIICLVVCVPLLVAGAYFTLVFFTHR
jgi:hypothetical protein